MLSYHHPYDQPGFYVEPHHHPYDFLLNLKRKARIIIYRKEANQS